MIKMIPLPQIPQAWRIGLLAITLSGAVVVIGRAIATPKTVATEAPVPTFPQSIPLPAGQFIQTSAVKSDKGAVLGQQYTYQTPNQPNAATITAEVRQELGDGNVSRFLFVHTPIRTANSTLQVRFQKDMGYYGVLTHEGKAYLSACINPRGGSTVTEQQFTQNRYQYDLNIGRLVPWITGQESLLDRRCMWTLMSTTVTPGTPPEIAYKTLEAAWFPWSQWWQSNFPRA
jgi:cyanosortase A-associated protein